MTDVANAYGHLDLIGPGSYAGNDRFLSSMLGPIPGIHGETNPYEARAVETWNLPKGYERQSLLLQDTVVDLILTADQTYLQIVCPIMLIDDLTVETLETQMLPQLMRPTPYQAPANLLQSKTSSRKGKLVRYSIMAQFEAHRLKSPAGRAMFGATIRQMENSVLETMNAHTLRALVNAYTFQNLWLRQNRPMTVKDFLKQIERDVNRFAISQKTKNGLPKLDAEINKEVQANNGRTDTWLIPEDVAIQQTFVPPESTDYDKAGYRGPDRINNGAGARKAGAGSNGTLDRVEPAHFIESAQVFIVKARHVDNLSPEEQSPFTRCRQLGEFVRMTHDMCDDNGTTYRSINRSILMYDEDVDDMKRITLDMALDNCGLFDTNGDVINIKYTKNMEPVDLEQDFLTHRDPSTGDFDTCKWLFQIHPRHLSVNHILRAAETMMATSTRVNGNPNITNANIRRIMGDSAIFYYGADDVNNWVNSSFAPGEGGIYQRFANKNDARRQDRERPTRVAGESDFKKVEDTLIAALNSQIHESRTADANAIIASSLSTLEKAEQLKEKMLECVDAKLNEQIKEPSVAIAWYNKLVGQYKAKVAQIKATAATAAAEPMDVDEPTTTGTRFPSHSSEIAAVVQERQTQPQSQQQQQPQRRLQAGGMGLSDIGAFDWAEGRSPENYAQNVRKALDRDNITGLDEHLMNLAGSGATDLLKQWALAYLFLSTKKQTFQALIRNDVVLPMNFLLFSPNKQYVTNTAVKLLSNGGACNLFMGNSNFTRGGDIGTTTQTLRFDTHMLPFVHTSRNIYVQPDVRSAAYEGGGGTKFFNADLYRNMNMEEMNHSIICVAVPITENEFGPNQKVMDISGRFYVNTAANLIVGTRSDPLHYSTAPRYNALYGFAGPNRSVRGLDQPDINFNRSHVNRIVIQGHQQNYNPKSGKYDKITVNQGHWGKDVYAGVGKVRNGGLVHIENKDYSSQ